MSFQNPLLLYGLIALVIPVIIHFFNFRRTRKVYFSNTRFLKKVKETTATKKRLKHYLILLSRLAFLFFLILAFAQPFIPASDDGNAQDPVYVYIDNSWSMSNEVDDGVTSLERGISYADELIRRFPATTRYRLFTNDFLPSSRTLKSNREMEELITEIKYSGLPRTSDEIISRLKAENEGSGMKLFWVSDFQRSTLGETVEKIDSASQMNLLPMTFSNKSNVFVDSLYVENPLMIANEQVTLHIILGKIGGTGNSEIIAKVYLDGVQSGTAGVTLGASGRSELTFDLSVDRTRSHKGKIVFEEFPVTFDNEFNFVLNVPESQTILEVTGDNEVTPVSLVFGNEELFSVVSQPALNLDYNLIGLSDLVALNGIDVLDLPLATALNRYLMQGGVLLLIPGRNPDVESFRLLQGNTDLSLIDSASMQALVAPDYDNPFFNNIFEERSDRLQMPSAIPLWKWNGPAEYLLRFTSGEPFLSRRSGDAQVYLLSTPLIDQFGNFARQALYVPVMYKISVSGKSDRNELYRYVNQSSFSFPKDSASAEALYRLVREDEEIIPEQRVDGNRVYFEVPRYTLTSGFYDLFLEGEQVGVVAFNNDPEESDLRQLSTEEIRNAYQGGNIDILEAGDQADFGSVLSEKYIGKTLWKEALLLALLFLVIEVLLIRFMP